jgi:HlyD family secretion protein
MNRGMNMLLNKAFGSLIIVSLIGGGLLSSCAQPTANARGLNAVHTEVLAAGPMDRTVRATGYIQPAAEIKLSFQQPGNVQKVAIDVAQPVKKGDVIAQLDTTDLELAQSQSQANLAQARLAVENAKAQVIVVTDNYSRTVEGSRQADIDAAGAAYTAAVKNYDKVKAGSQPEDYAQAEAGYRNAEAAVKKAQADYDRAYSSNPAGIGGSPAGLALEQATNNFNAAKSMYDKVAKPSDAAVLSAANQQVQGARASLDRLNQPARSFDIEQAATQVAQAKLQVQTALVQVQLADIQVKQALRRIEQATIKAPVDGQISAVNVKVGENVATQPVITMVDNSQYYIDITVDEVDIAQVKVGQDAQVVLDALTNTTVKGTILRINPTSTTVNGVVSYTVRVLIGNDTPQLRAGMTARTTIAVDRRADILQAPNWALRTDAQTGKTYLTVKNGNGTQEVEVKLGARNDAFSEVLSGAQAGMTVVAP